MLGAVHSYAQYLQCLDSSHVGLQLQRACDACCSMPVQAAATTHAAGTMVNAVQAGANGMPPVADTAIGAASELSYLVKSYYILQSWRTWWRAPSCTPTFAGTARRPLAAWLCPEDHMCWWTQAAYP